MFTDAIGEDIRVADIYDGVGDTHDSSGELEKAK